MANEFTVARPPEAVLVTNKLIRNTYTLLSMTLLFSALTATLGVYFQVGRGFSLLMFGLAFVLLLFVLRRYANSAAGLGIVFVITGALGASLGPMLTHYLSLPNGSQVVFMALSGTGVIFLGLSGYALTTRKDFSFMGGFLIVGFLVALMAIVANIFLAIPALSLAISAIVIMLMSGFILYDTSRMIHGGETNYILATVGLYISIFNIFVHLLAILGIMGDD